jgi:hypothetical protein
MKQITASECILPASTDSQLFPEAMKSLVTRQVFWLSRLLSPSHPETGAVAKSDKSVSEKKFGRITAAGTAPDLFRMKFHRIPY